ncbi:MAG: thiamine-phosphate kinase [Candidatus Dormibacteraeota bacterium]|nr:thiamine-phosphate kinase [Candidatus Dormibacteraeota bacterium]
MGLAAGDGRLAIGPGDDAAVWELGGRALAITTDSLVERVDFLRSFQTPWEVGLKAWGAAASDVAAMGFGVEFGVACLICSPDTFEGTVLDIQEGMVEGARRDGALLAGGDVSSTDGPLTIAVTVVGSGPAGQAVRLGGAVPGDAVAVTGRLGGASAALQLLEHGAVPPEAWRRRLVAPVPRLAEGRRLRAAGAHAMTDLSDGLLLDAARLAAASSCRLELWADHLPLEHRLEHFFPGGSLQLGAGGGEDYELLVCLPEPVARQLSSASRGTGISVVGTVREGEGVRLLERPDGPDVALPDQGFRHF